MITKICRALGGRQQGPSSMPFAMSAYGKSCRLCKIPASGVAASILRARLRMVKRQLRLPSINHGLGVIVLPLAWIIDTISSGLAQIIKSLGRSKIDSAKSHAFHGTRKAVACSEGYLSLVATLSQLGSHTGLSAGLSEGFPWYALWVRSRHEKSVAEILGGKGFETFLPLHTSRRRWSGSRAGVWSCR